MTTSFLDLWRRRRIMATAGYPRPGCIVCGATPNARSLLCQECDDFGFWEHPVYRAWGAVGFGPRP